MKKNKVVFVMAHDNFNYDEYIIPKRIVEGAGYVVITAGDQEGTAHSENNVSTPIHMTLEKLSILDYDALVFIGGPGALKYLDNDRSYRIIQDAVMHNIAVGAICSATRILAKAGALVSKNATGWNEDGMLQDVFEKHGVLYSDDPVVIDGLCITAQGPEVAEPFAHGLLGIM